MYVPLCMWRVREGGRETRVREGRRGERAIGEGGEGERGRKEEGEEERKKEREREREALCGVGDEGRWGEGSTCIIIITSTLHGISSCVG